MNLNSLSKARAFIALTKPTIVGLVILTGLGGMFITARGVPPWDILLVVTLGGGMTAGGAGVINHYMERNIDSLMSRTKKRPLPLGTISPPQALIVGIILNVIGFTVLALWANFLSAFLALGASLFYIFVYTGWLKRSTPQNIVIGGASGAMPPLVAAAAVTGTIPLSALYLFGIIFFWTPPHFWALALFLKEDYAKAKVPMLPVVQGDKATCWNILLYSIILAVINTLFLITGEVGAIYLGPAVILSGLFIFYAVRLLRNPTPDMGFKVFRFSLVYLAVLFLVVILDSMITF